MKKFTFFSVLLFALSSFVFAEEIKQPSSENNNSCEFSIGGYSNIDVFTDSDNDSMTNTNVDAQIYVEFTQDMGSYYAGAKLSLMGMTRGYDSALQDTEKAVAGYAAQGVLGLSKSLLSKGTFKVKAFAEVAGGVLISPLSEQVNQNESGQQHMKTEYQLAVSPQAGISVQVECFTVKAFCTTNWIHSIGMGNMSMGLATGITW